MTSRTSQKIELPDRRFLNLWNSFDLSHFRAAEQEWEDWDAKKDEMTKRARETKQVARETGTNLVDLGFVADSTSRS